MGKNIRAARGRIYTLETNFASLLVPFSAHSRSFTLFEPPRKLEKSPALMIEGACRRIRATRRCLHRTRGRWGWQKKAKQVSRIELLHFDSVALPESAEEPHRRIFRKNRPGRLGWAASDSSPMLCVPDSLHSKSCVFTLSIIGINHDLLS